MNCLRMIICASLLLVQSVIAQEHATVSAADEAESIRFGDRPQLLVSLSPATAATDGLYENE